MNRDEFIALVIQREKEGKSWLGLTIEQAKELKTLLESQKEEEPGTWVPTPHFHA